MKVTGKDGITVDVADAAELEVAIRVLRGLGAASKAPATAPTEERDSEERPRSHGRPALWTSVAAHEVQEQLSGRALKVFHMLRVAGDEWTDSQKIYEGTGAKPQGQAAVLRPISRAAADLNRPDPVQCQKGRNGQIRYTRWRLTPEFLNAVGAASEDPPME